MAVKNILQGVKPMWYGNPSAVCFIGSVMRLMEYIEDPIDESELFALSGVGLCFPWRFISSCDEVSIIPEIPARTFEALGYQSEYITGDSFSFDKIKQSIDNGRPVIGFGITTKSPMTCVITGYDENGLYMRSFWSPDGENYDSCDYFYSADWRDNCSGLLIIGDKTGDRLKGAAAYSHITDWALKFRCYKRSVTAENQDIYINQYAFDAIIDWLFDDEQWNKPDLSKHEQYLKQCGLLLFGHYRYHLYEYLKKLDNDYPGLVNKPALTELERIGKAIPGAETSDLWLHEAVDPLLKDFNNMRNPELRKKTAGYVTKLKDYDNFVQWTLFMPDFVKNQTKGFSVDNFEYRQLPAMRFIGAEGDEYSDIDKRLGIMRTLDSLSEYKSGFDYDILFMHHYGLEVDNPWHGVWGRFMKADTPVPDGFLSFDFVPDGDFITGPPYFSQFAFATFSGDIEAMHSNVGFDSDAMYDITRNIVLGDGVVIPYPEKYWTAEVFFNGCDNPGTGYLFSIHK